MDPFVFGELKRSNYIIGESEAVYREIAIRMGLNNSSMKILYAICNEGTRCPLKKLITLSGMAKQTANSALRKLEAEGIVYLESSGKKGKTVCLTEAGKDLCKRTVMKVIQAENDILSSWPVEEVKLLNRLSEKYLIEMKEAAKHMDYGE